jgi:putative transposase
MSASPSDLLTETLLGLCEAARRLPPGRGGRSVSFSCVLRWITHGVPGPDGRRVKLEAVRVGGRWLTSVEALARWAERLTARGRRCCVNTVAKLMRDNGIRAKTARKSRHTTDSNHELAVAGNLLARRFGPDGPNVAWSADSTYIPTADGWLYLAVVEDLFSRMIVGWSMDASMTSRLVVDALDMAVRRRVPEGGLLAHSDRGSQYASEYYQRLLEKHGVRCSMSGEAQCWDNAPVESFFASLKKELVHHEAYTTRAEAKASLFEYVEAFYNRTRRHSSLGYLSPAEFERAHNPNHP